MTGAGLVIAFYLPGRAGAADANGNFAPNAWLQIDPQGEISLWVARSEMGQGVRTSMSTILAEELEADWTHVKIVQADSDAKYGDMVTGGSASVRPAGSRCESGRSGARDVDCGGGERVGGAGGGMLGAG